MTKKVLKIFICLAFILTFSFGIAGCTTPEFPEYRGPFEAGDFTFYYYGGAYSIDGTTEEGRAKRFLVVPEQIDGIPVDTFAKTTILAPLPPDIKSETLEKIFFTSKMDIGDNFYDSESFGCPNLNKIFFVSGWETGGWRRLWDCTVYYPRKISDDYNSKLEPGRAPELDPANVSYYYNYENAENSGYYWIDDCDYDGKIEFIPENPVREGYTFGGWYKETECINEWNFEVDTLPEKKTELKETYVNMEQSFVEVAIYQETILYAKWIED